LQDLTTEGELNTRPFLLHTSTGIARLFAMPLGVCVLEKTMAYWFVKTGLLPGDALFLLLQLHSYSIVIIACLVTPADNSGYRIGCQTALYHYLLAFLQRTMR
jgi:hypothetical protein